MCPSIDRLSFFRANLAKRILMLLSILEFLNRIRLRQWMGLLVLTVSLGTLGLPALAHAAVTTDPTEAAFDALLSLPQAQPPESAWQEQPPEGFNGEQESDLIAWLAKQKKQGANFNAYRHNGTLLHHAVRAGLEETALWLLEHGADPVLPLKEEEESEDGESHVERNFIDLWRESRVENRLPGNDTLRLAVYYRRWRVFDVLLQTPALQNLPREALADLIWSAVLGEGDTDEETLLKVVQELLQRQMPLPNELASACLLQYALDRSMLKLALALPGRQARLLTAQEWNGLPKITADRRANQCAPWSQPQQPTGHQKISVLTDADIERLDAKLEAPVFPYLMTMIDTSQDVERLFQLRIRRPFDDAAFTQQIISRILASNSPVETGLLLFKRLPTSALQHTLDTADATLQIAWLGWWFNQKEIQDFAWGLDQLSATRLNQHAPALLHAPASYPFTPKSAENWALLLARLDPPLDRDGATRLLNQTPPSVWPLLLARGYRIKTDELDQWLASASPAQLRENWSLLKEPLSTQPAGPMASVLKKFLSQERCAWGLGRYVDENKEGGIEQNDVDKVKFLLEAGVRVAEPLKLDTVCIQRSKPEQYAALLATGTIHPLDTTNARRFVSEPLHCRIVPSPALFHALSIRSLTGETGEVAIDTVQALEYPNAEDCALLLSGGGVSARLFIDEDSFYGPYRLTPCPDPTLSGAVLRVVENDVQMEPMGEGASEGLLPLRDTATGRRYFLARNIPGSTCDGGRSAALLGWMTQGDKTTLQALPQDDPAWQALLEQCSLAHADSEESCLGLPPRPNPETATESAKPAWDEIQAVDLFIKTYWSQERQAFLQALLKLDFTQLKAFREQGIPGEWVWAALEAVTAADLPIAVKRQCTAWLFRNPMALSAALKNDGVYEQQLRGLVAWLPSEDWGPMLAALDEGSYLLSVLQEEAEKQHKKRLACRFAKAAHQDCSAIPDAEP